MLSRISAGILLLIGATVPAYAQDFTPSWGMGVTATYDTNIGLSSFNEQSGMVLQVSPYYTLQRSGGRASTTFTYAPQAVIYPDGTYPDQFWQYLSASSNIEVIRRFFSLNVYAAAQPNIVNPRQAVGGLSGVTNTNPNNLSQTFVFGITPTFTFSVGPRRYATVSISPGINYAYNSRGDVGNYGATNSSISITSGPYFSRMPWSLTYSGSFLNNQQNNRFQSTTGTVSYVFNQKWRAYLNLIYDNNSYRSTSSTSGLGWQAGLSWTPTTRTSITAGYGDRYYGAWPTLTLTHQSGHTAWSASWTSTVQNVRQQQLNQQLFPVTDAFGNPVLNPVTQQQLLLPIGTPALINSVYESNNLSARVSTNWTRTPASLSVNYYQTKYQDLALDTDDYTIYGTIGRDISRRTSLNLSVQWWEHIEQNVSPVNYTQKLASVYIQHNITRHLSSQLGYTFTKRSANNPLDQYDDNQVFLTFVFSRGGGTGTASTGGRAGLGVGGPGGYVASPTGYTGR
jgi:uncharacterized protein (PEP-CTERM system associated)